MALIRNLESLRTIPGFGQKLVEALQDLQKLASNVASQTNSALKGAQGHPPPPINALHVEGGAGIYHAYITDQNQSIYRGIQYTLEYSEDPSFSTFHVAHMGPSRDHRLNIGLPGPLHFRAYSGYPTSPSSTPVYHGTQVNPIAVSGGGTTPPILRGGQGSGTNPPNLGGGGFGQFPWRGTTPPRRS